MAGTKEQKIKLCQLMSGEKLLLNSIGNEAVKVINLSSMRRKRNVDMFVMVFSPANKQALLAI